MSTQTEPREKHFVQVDSRCYEALLKIAGAASTYCECKAGLYSDESQMALADLNDALTDFEQIGEEQQLAEDHVHSCQQCDKVLERHCGCGKPNINMWCSSRCRAAFDL